MAITSLQLAQLCGTSRGTVDRVLKNRPGVNEETRKRVLEAAARCRYRPNIIGQTLVSGKSNTIGVVFFDFSHDFFAELFSAFEREADQLGYVVFPVLSYHDPKREIECINRLLDRRVDGIILLPVNSGAEFESFLGSISTPVVTIANRLSDRFSFSGPDNRKASFEAAEYLFQAHPRNIHYYSPTLKNRLNANRSAQEDRRDGWADAKAKFGFSGNEYHTAEQLLSALCAGDAVMASSDFYALRLQAELREFYPHLFPEVTIMGFDNLSILPLFSKPISTVSFSLDLWAKAAIAQLLELLDGKAASQVAIPHEIIPAEKIGKLEHHA